MAYVPAIVNSVFKGYKRNYFIGDLISGIMILSVMDGSFMVMGMFLPTIPK